MALALGIMVVTALSLAAQNQNPEEGRAPEVKLDVVVRDEQGDAYQKEWKLEATFPGHLRVLQIRRKLMKMVELF